MGCPILIKECPVSDSEQMGRNEYARHRGCSANAVTKAVRDGRIARAVIWDGGQIKSIKWRLADELWLANTDVGRAPLSSRTPAMAPAPASPAMHIAVRLQALLGYAIGDAFVAWAALLVGRYRMEAELATSAIVDLHAMQAIALSLRTGGDGETDSALITGDLKLFLSLDDRPALLERIRAAAEVYREKEQ